MPSYFSSYALVPRDLFYCVQTASINLDQLLWLYEKKKLCTGTSNAQTMAFINVQSEKDHGAKNKSKECNIILCLAVVDYLNLNEKLYAIKIDRKLLRNPKWPCNLILFLAAVEVDNLHFSQVDFFTVELFHN